MSSPTLSSRQIDSARDISAATLHEAAGRIGALPSSIKPVNPQFTLCGPAFTVHGPPVDNLWIHRAVYAAQTGDILVVSTSGGIEAGYWGDILNEAAIKRGLGGLVIEGGVRDARGLAAAAFPVFSAGLCIRGTGKDQGATGWLNRAIRIGDVIVNPGDLVVGDMDGIVVIPSQRVDEVIAKSRQRDSDEAEKIRLIRGGARTIDLYGLGAAPPPTA